MKETRYDNNETDDTNVVYAEKGTKQLWPIRWSMFVTKTRQDKNVTHCIGMVYVKNNIE